MKSARSEMLTFGKVTTSLTQRGIISHQPIVFDHRVVQAMMPLRVGRVDLRPWRREECAAVIAMLSDTIEGRLAGHVLECRRGIDQSAVEEDPPPHPTRLRPIGQCNGHCPARESRSVNPGQARSVSGEFLPDDPPSRLFDNAVTTPRKLRQQR